MLANIGFRILVRFKQKSELVSKTNIDRLSTERDVLVMVLTQVIYFFFFRC